MQRSGQNSMAKFFLRLTPEFLALMFTAAVLITVAGASGSPVELAPSQEPIPASYFTLNILFHPNDHVPWPSVPFYGWRVWHALWFDLEPQKGQWNFDHLDALVNLAEQHHSEMLLILAYAPAWASTQSDPKSDWQAGSAGPLRDINDWKNYVRTVGTRYKGRIHTYEVWNEPDRSHAWLGSVDSMVEMTRDAHQILKEIDPSNVVVGPSMETAKGPEWLNEFLSKGGAQAVDIIGYHFYTGNENESGPPEDMIPLIQKVREVMEQNHVGQKQLWDTEAGWHLPNPFPSEDMAAAYVARAYILNWAAGVSRYYWYCWDEHNWAALRVTWQDGSLRAGGKAYATIQAWLKGATMQSCSTSDGKTWICTLERGGALQYIVWNTDGNTRFDMPRNWRVKSLTRLSGEVSAISQGPVSIGIQPALLQ